MGARAVAAAAACIAAALALCACTGAPTAGPPGPAASSASATSTATVPAWLSKVDTIGMLGDSISNAVYACGAYPTGCPADTWAGGSNPKVDSIASRIAAVRGSRPRVVNQALSGGELSSMLPRVRQVVAAAPQLVTIMIGVNDACAPSVDAMTPVSQYTTEFAQALDELHRGAPDAHVLVMSIPDLTTLWKLGRDDPALVAQWKDRTTCASMLANPTSDAPADVARRAAVSARIDAYNEVMAQACAKYARCHDDGGAVHAHPFTDAELSSVDHFHPSVLGQRELAALGWHVLVRAGG
ncbi:GDSL-type esterase/lipase family protein [Gryllotalpicola ginsengisoli]|uniref:GDSL-type esterase/lipase family protein n=1 Tax=Gryllotalpicola ginsengisoli TaxID=444608 RepID=UPI0003B73A48|nr:GDSL-type esterase/lipase family protein [Gryllotalpicola ginsengisoli]